MATSLLSRNLLALSGERLLSSEGAGTSSSQGSSASQVASRSVARKRRSITRKTGLQGVKVCSKTKELALARSHSSHKYPPSDHADARGAANRVPDGKCFSGVQDCLKVLPADGSRQFQRLKFPDYDLQGLDVNLLCRKIMLAGLASALVSATTSMPVLAETHLEVGQPVQQESVSLGPPELSAQLDAQIRRDLRTDLELGLGPVFPSTGGTSLLELAERSAEIDSRLPLDSGFGAAGGSPLNRDLGPDIVAASLPSAAAASTAASLAVTSSAAIATSAAGAAATMLQPAAAALASPAVGLSTKLTAILAQAAQHFGGGGIAGAIGATVVYPLDTVKTKMQAQREEEGEDEPVYKNELDCLVKMVKKDGVGSLYSGLGPQLLGVAPEKALKLTVNELLLSILETFLPGSKIWTLELVAGGGGGFSQVVFTNPVETVKVRLQTQTQAEGLAQKDTWQVVKELGVKGLYSGSTVTMARDIPASAIFFACYAFLKQVNPDQFFINGCLAAIPAAIVVTPMDVIKTRLTVEPLPGQEPYEDAWDCIQKLVKNEGVGALFKGCASRVLRLSPQFGITLCIYDMISH